MANLSNILVIGTDKRVIFEVIFMREWQSALVFQLRNKGAKEVLHEAITKFYLTIFKFEVKL